MPTSWADSVENAAGGTGGGRPAYVPPHLRNRPPSSDSCAAVQQSGPSGGGNVPISGNRWSAPRNEFGRSIEYQKPVCSGRMNFFKIATILMNLVRMVSHVRGETRKERKNMCRQ